MVNPEGEANSPGEMGSGANEYRQLQPSSQVEISLPQALNERLPDAAKEGLANFLAGIDVQRAAQQETYDRRPYIEGITDDGTVVLVDEMYNSPRRELGLRGRLVMYVAPAEQFADPNFQPIAAGPEDISGMRMRDGGTTDFGLVRDEKSVFSIHQPKPGVAENPTFKYAGGERSEIHALRPPRVETPPADQRVAEARAVIESQSLTQAEPAAKRRWGFGRKKG